ncbi:unnamed protein product, partial [Ectocarpus sp. 13 AM-2016]
TTSRGSIRNPPRWESLPLVLSQKPPWDASRCVSSPGAEIDREQRCPLDPADDDPDHRYRHWPCLRLADR